MKEALRAVASGCYHNTYIPRVEVCFTLNIAAWKMQVNIASEAQWHTQSSNSSMQIKLYQYFIDIFFFFKADQFFI